MRACGTLRWTATPYAHRGRPHSDLLPMGSASRHSQGAGLLECLVVRGSLPVRRISDELRNSSARARESRARTAELSLPWDCPLASTTKRWNTRWLAPSPSIRTVRARVPGAPTRSPVASPSSLPSPTPCALRYDRSNKPAGKLGGAIRRRQSCDCARQPDIRDLCFHPGHPSRGHPCARTRPPLTHRAYALMTDRQLTDQVVVHCATSPANCGAPLLSHIRQLQSRTDCRRPMRTPTQEAQVVAHRGGYTPPFGGFHTVLWHSPS